MKYSKSAIGLLTAQYRSVLKKCWMINVGLFALGGALLTATPAEAEHFTVSTNGSLYSSGNASDGNKVELWNTSSNIGYVDITAASIVNLLGSTAVNNATNDADGHDIRTTYVKTTTLGDYLKSETAASTYETIANVNALKNGNTAFSKVNVGGMQLTSDGSTLSVPGNISLTTSGATLNLGSAVLGSDGTKVYGQNMRVDNLYFGTAETAMTGVDNAVTAGNSTKLITSGAVATAINAAKAEATGYTYSGPLPEGVTTNIYAGIDKVSTALDAVGNSAMDSAAKIAVLNDADTNTKSVSGKIKTALTTERAAGEVASGNTSLVTGGKVFTAINTAQTTLQNQINTLNDEATVTGSVAQKISKAFEDNSTTNITSTGTDATKLATSGAVAAKIADAKTEAGIYTSATGMQLAGKIFEGKTTFTAAMDEAGKQIEGNASKLSTLMGSDTTNSIEQRISAQADGATHTNADASTSTIGEAINTNAQAIADLNAADTNDKSVAYKIKNNAAKASYNASADDYTTGTIGKAIQDNTTNITANSGKLAGLALSDGTAATTVQAAIDSARKGVSGKQLNIGEDASEVRLGKADGSASFTGLSVDNATKAISLKSQGSTKITGMDIANNGNINLGVTSADTLHGIEISNNGNTITFKGTGSTDVASITDGVLTAKSATLSGLKMGDNTASKISSAAAISSEGTNDTLATTSAVYNTVKGVSDALASYATTAEVHGSADVTAVNLGEQAKTVNVGADAGVAISNDTAKSAELKVKTGEGKKTAVTVSANDIKIGNTNGDNFDGITYNSTNGVVIGSGDNTVTAKAGALTATGNITSNATVKGANLEATAGLKIGSAEATSIDKAGTGASGTTAPTDGKALASTLTVWNAVDAAKDAVTKYTPSAGLSGQDKVYEGVTTVTGGLEAAGSAIETNKTNIAANATKLDGLKLYDGTTAADTVQEALADFKTKSQAYTLDNIKTGAQNADYDASTTYADGSIGAAIKANAGAIAGLGTTSATNLATPLTIDEPTDTEIKDWATTNALNVANVGTTFDVLSKKLTNVQADLMAGAHTSSSIANSLATAQQKTDDASLHDVIASIATEAGDAVYVAKTDLTPANGQVVLGKDSTAFTEKGTSFTVDTANSKVSAKVFKPSAGSGDVTKTTSFELSNDGFKVTSQEGNSADAAKTVTIADGVVSAEGLKLGTNDVTSIDAGAALDITTDVADADKKVMATDAAVKATVKALAEGAVATNTARFAGFTDGQTVAQYIDANAKDAKYDDNQTIAQAIANAKGAADTLKTDLATANKGDLVDGSNIIDGSITNAKLAEKSVKWANLGAGVQRRIENDEADIATNTADIATNTADIATKYNFSNIVKGANEAAPTANTQVYSKVAADEAIASGVSGRILLANPDYSPEGPQYMKEVLGNLDTYGDKAVSAGAMAQFAKEIGFNMKQDQLGWDINVDTSNADSFSKKLTSTLYNNTPAAPERTVVSALNTAGDAIVKLNGDVNTDGSVLKSIKDNADDATHGDTTIGAAITANTDKLANLKVEQGDAETVQNAIDYASAGAAEDLANVLNGTTPFTTLNVDGMKVNGDSNKFTVENSAGTTLSTLTANGYYLYNGDGKMYLSANKDKFKLLDANGKGMFSVDNTNGNVVAKGDLTLGSDETATLTVAKIKQITTNADNIGDMSELHARDNAMINRDADDQATTPAANIVEALNNISASVGNVHGLATAAADGSLDTKYASQQKPADWYKNGAGNLFAGSEVDDHLAELAASIGNRNYAAGTPYLNANESVATSLVALANGLQGVADNYVTKEYFNGGTATTPATISMGANASDIVIGHASAGTTDAGTTIDVNHTEGKITNSVLTAGVGAAQTTTTTELSANGFKVAHNGKTVSVADGTITFNNGRVLKDNGNAIWTDGDVLVNGNISSGASIYSGANLGVTGEASIGTNLGVGGDTTLAGKLGFGGNTFESVAKTITANSTDAELPTAKAVYDVVKTETTVEAAPNGNYAAGSVKDALKTVDSRMGNVSWYKNSTHYANPNSTAGLSLSAAIRNIDANVYAKVGAVDFTDTMHYVSSADTDLTTAIKSMDTNVFNAIGGLDNKYVTKAYFSAGDANNLIWMGDAASDIRIGTKKSVGGTDSLNSGVEVLADATNGDSVTIKASGATASTGITVKAGDGTAANPAAIEIGTVGTDFTGIQVTENGKTVTFKGTNKDVTIVDGEVTAEKATVKTLAFTDGATDPTITTATSVDNAGKDVLADGVTSSGTELASTLTVKNTVDGAVKVGAATNGNYAAGTVKTAVADIDAAIGKRSAYRSSHYANPTNDDKDLSTAIKNLDDALFSVTEDYVTKTYFDGGDDTNHYISMGSLAKKVTIGADNSARIVLDVEDAAKKSITMTAGTDMQVAVNGTEITIGDKDGQGIKVDNGGKTTTFAGSTDAKKVVVEEGVVTASDGVVVGDKTGDKYAEITTDTATFKGANGTVTIADGTVTAKKFAFSDTAYATGIDNTGGVFTAAPADNYTIATTKTVYDNTYLTAAGARGNYAAGSVLDAVASIDKAIGNRAILNGTNYANPGASATTTNLSQAIKNLDTNVFAAVGDVDLSGATNYANTTATPADNLTEAVVNIDKNVKQAIDDLDGKFVTKAYFSGGEQDATSPNAGRIIMGDTANKITIGRTATSADVTNLTNGIEIDATTGNVVMGKQSITNNVASLETGVKVSADTGTVEIVSVDTTQNSSNGISVDKDIVKIGTTSNGKFEGISIQDGYVANVNKDDATKSAAFASDGFSVKDGDKLATMGADGFASVNGDKSATVGYNGIAVENGSKIATVAADGFAAKDGSNVATMNSAGFAATDGTKLTTVAADGVAAKNGDDLATMNSTGFAVTDSDNTATLGAKGLAVEDENHNGTYVGATGMSVTDGTDTTTIAAGSVTTKEVITDKLTLAGNSATAIDQGTALDPKAAITDADKTTLASNATVKASINGIVADIEKQIHGDPDHPETPVTIGEYADNTIIGKVSTDTSKPLNTNINVDTANNKITLETADISNDKQTSTGIELDNAKQTIDITSANGKLGTETGLKITNEGADDQHLIELTYTHKGQDDKVDTERGLVMDADNQTYSLGSTDVAGKTFSGLNMDAAGNTYALGKGTVDDQGKLTLDYGMTMDAEHGVTTFADKDGNGVTMNKGDMTVTDSATVGSVDAQGVLSGVKLDKDGNAQASASATVGQVKADGSLDGNGVQMKNDGSAKFSATEGAVTVEKGGVIADNNVTVGDNAADDYIDLAKQNDGSYKATFASADGNVEIAGGSITADNKVTADEIEAKTRFYVGDPAGAVTAMYQTGIVSKADEDNQSTYGATGLWTKADSDEATLGGTGLRVSDGTNTAGVSKTGSYAEMGGQKASYSYDGIWIENTTAKHANLNEAGLGLVDGTKNASYGIDGLYVTDGTDSSSVGPSGIHTTKDMYAEGAVNGKDLVARESFTLAGTTVHAIDDSNAKINDFSGAGHDVDTLATTSSIYYNAEDSLYTPQQGTYTTVDATTINEALTAVDNIIGNFPDGLKYDNHNLDNGGQAKPENIVDAFNNIDATLGQIHGLAAKLESEGTYMGNLAEGTTVENHLTALDASIGDRRSYTQQNVIKNNESTAKSLDALDMAVGDIAKLQGTTYASADNLSDAVVQIDDKLQNLDGRMERAEKDLKDVHHELRRGMASMAAMSALVPNSRSTGKTSLSLGTGAYSGHNAVAVGGFHYLTDNLMLNAGAAWSNSRDAVYRVGVTYSF